MILGLMLACRPRPAELVALLSTPPPPDPAPLPVTGVVHDGVWHDAVFPFSLTVPAGWTTVVGPGPELRLTLIDSEPGVVIEVHAVHGPTDTPSPRAGCIWDFVDTARYRVLPIPGPITVATCSPTRPDDPSVLGWYFQGVDTRWQVEATLAPTALRGGKDAAESILGTVRFRATAP